MAERPCFSAGHTFLRRLLPLLGLDPDREPIHAVELKADVEGVPEVTIHRYLEEPEADRIFQEIRTYYLLEKDEVPEAIESLSL